MADIKIESGFIQLYERKAGKAKWRPYVGVFELWKICNYRSERQARAHARLLKRKNPNKDYAVFVFSETRTIKRKFVDSRGCDMNGPAPDKAGEPNMTAEECIDRIAKVLSRGVTVAEGPHFQIDGRSTNIIYPGGKDTLERLFEIGSIIREYKKEI